MTVMRKRLSTIALTLLAGVVLAWPLMLFLGVGSGSASVGGVPVGYQRQPVAGEDAVEALKRLAVERELTDWHIEPWGKLEYTSAPRRCYYRARLVGSYTVDVVLSAPDGGKWTVAEWRQVE